MSGWLSKATGALRGEAPETPQPFESLCECGVRHTGLRRRKSQRLVCRSCGTSLFVLPRDAYPVPAAPPPKQPKKRKKPKSRSSRAATPAPVIGKRVFKQATQGVAKASAKVGRGAADAGIGFGARVAAYVRGFIGFWTPLRLVVLGIVVICGITAAVTLFSDRSEQAVIALTDANEKARAAMAAGDFVAAQSEFTKAVTLLDQLHREDDPLAREIRQLHRETSAIRDIVAMSPLDIVAEADAALLAGKTPQWADTFETRYKDRWIVVEGDASSADRALSGGAYHVPVPFGVGPHARNLSIQVSMPLLDSLIKAGKPRPIVLAGQIESCELSRDQRTWTLRLRRETAFLWTNADNYQALGFTFDDPQTADQTRAMLNSQARALGLEPQDQG
jgi:hypothetical protein